MAQLETWTILRFAFFYPMILVFGLVWSRLFWVQHKRNVALRGTRHERWSALLGASLSGWSALSICSLALTQVTGFSTYTSLLVTVGIALPTGVVFWFAASTALLAWYDTKEKHDDANT